MNAPRKNQAAKRHPSGGSAAAADSIWGEPSPTAQDSSFLQSPPYATDSSYEMTGSGTMPPSAVFQRPLRIVNVIDVPTAQQSPHLDPVRAAISEHLGISANAAPGGPATSAMDPSVRSRSE